MVAEEEKTDNKLSSSATITVEVQDLNDNNPEFDLESYTATIPESALPGENVYTITLTLFVINAHYLTK